MPAFLATDSVTAVGWHNDPNGAECDACVSEQVHTKNSITAWVSVGVAFTKTALATVCQLPNHLSYPLTERSLSFLACFPVATTMLYMHVSRYGVTGIYGFAIKHCT